MVQVGVGGGDIRFMVQILWKQLSEDTRLPVMLCRAHWWDCIDAKAPLRAHSHRFQEQKQQPLGEAMVGYIMVDGDTEVGLGLASSHGDAWSFLHRSPLTGVGDRNGDDCDVCGAVHSKHFKL